MNRCTVSCGSLRVKLTVPGIQGREQTIWDRMVAPIGGTWMGFSQEINRLADGHYFIFMAFLVKAFVKVQAKT